MKENFSCFQSCKHITNIDWYISFHRKTECSTRDGKSTTILETFPSGLLKYINTFHLQVDNILNINKVSSTRSLPEFTKYSLQSSQLWTHPIEHILGHHQADIFKVLWVRYKSVGFLSWYLWWGIKGRSTLATLFSHRWPRFCGGVFVAVCSGP